MTIPRTLFWFFVPALVIAADPAPPAGQAPKPSQATSQATIKREGTRVTIENAPEVGWGKTNPCTFLGCLEAATSVTAHPAKYDALQVYSGLAFRIRWYRGLKEDKWHGVSPIGELPEEMTAITKATGWHFDVRQGRAGALAAEICKSIDAGVCVLGYVNPAEFDVGFIRGYEDGGKRWLVSDYYKGYATVPGDDPHDFIVFLRHQEPQLTPKEAVWHGLNTGVQNWKRGEPPAEEVLPWEQKGQAKLCYGEAAYDQMIQDISQSPDPAPGQQHNLRHVRAWVMDNLRDSRRSAAQFLSPNARLLGKEAEARLLKAAEIYARMAATIEGLQQKREAFAFMEAPEWTDKVRKREVEALKELAKWDEEAIGELEKAIEPAGK